MIIHLLAEGQMEVAVAKRLIPFCGHHIGTIYGQHGCSYIKKKAANFCHLATGESGLLILTDFRDAQVACIIDALQSYLGVVRTQFPPSFLCRFAVNELESWLLADREAIAQYLGIAVANIPHQPEAEEYPKRTLVNLARKSKRKEIRERIAPPLGHSASVGPGYSGLLYKYIADLWSIEKAMSRAPSLERCVRRLRGLARTGLRGG